MTLKYKNAVIDYTINSCTLKPNFPKIKKPPPPPRPKKKKLDDDCEKKCMSCNFKCNWDNAAIARLNRDMRALNDNLKIVKALTTLTPPKGELIADIDDDPKKNPKFPYKGDGLSGIKDEIEALSKQLNVIGNSIGIGDIIVSHPIDWELKAEHHREQLVVIYLEDKGNNKYGKTPYTIHIPHFDKSKFSTLRKSSFPVYEKGNIIGILTLSDNSKIIINANNRDECERVINVLKTFVRPSYLQGSWLKMTDRKDDLKSFTAAPYKIEYYIEGSKSSTIESKYLQ